MGLSGHKFALSICVAISPFEGWLGFGCFGHWLCYGLAICHSLLGVDVLLCVGVWICGWPKFGVPKFAVKNIDGNFPFAGWLVSGCGCAGLVFCYGFPVCVAVWLVVMCWFKGLGGFGVEPSIVLASLR